MDGVDVEAADTGADLDAEFAVELVSAFVEPDPAADESGEVAESDGVEDGAGGEAVFLVRLSVE